MAESLEYKLLYWPQIPGRGEFIRLCFEATGVPYTEENSVPELQALLLNKDDEGIGAPHFAVPILGVRDSNTKTTGGIEHYISQTPAILSFLAPRLGLLGDANKLQGFERDVAVAQINQLTLTALDLNNETHDTHHPISVSSYYEDQKEEAKQRAADFRANRLPKFLQVFELALGPNEVGLDRMKEGALRMWGSKTTVADLTVFQVIDGLQFALPKCMQKLKDSGKYKHVFRLHKEIRAELKGYLNSDRRKPYSDGVFRHYPELDDE
ncbi:Thioredoxin-like fold [Kalmanozyma brasiliensis GHG001]|uniref:GST N-terminal domain-containing protein n=1 Tax=Kalmanozyma brasiliensis (strain GHG001) TaxID=1365824 RepID=V5F3G1_KALBG|nr:Thioredoxin-like fold [Kalmanozyma brasiliensis GHG001]EST10034.1 Thioredoxin-like fold [Kalmanozyma brasiliensis GHG001]